MAESTTLKVKPTKKQLEALRRAKRIFSTQDINPQSTPRGRSPMYIWGRGSTTRVQVQHKLEKPIRGYFGYQERVILYFDVFLVDGEVWLHGVGASADFYGRHDPETGFSRRGEEEAYPRADALAKALQEMADKEGWGDPPTERDLRMQQLKAQLGPLVKLRDYLGTGFKMRVRDLPEMPEEIRELVGMALQHAEDHERSVREEYLALNREAREEE